MVMTVAGFVRLSAASALLFAAAACATPPPPTQAPPKPPAPQATPAPTPATPEDQYRVWIKEARLKHPYPESEARMHAVMMCESGGKPTIVNPAGPYTGLFQYSNPTWNGAWNTYRNDGIRDAKAQIFATALAWNLKMQNQWGCYKKTASAG